MSMRRFLLILLCGASAASANEPPTFATPQGTFDFAAWTYLFQPYVRCMRESAILLESSMEPAADVATAAESRCSEALDDAKMHSEIALSEFNAWASKNNRVPPEETRRALARVSEIGRQVVVTAVVSLRAERNADAARKP